MCVCKILHKYQNSIVILRMSKYPVEIRNMSSVVRVGVACLIKSPDHPNSILLGIRKGSHGAGKLATPGGHLELGESWVDCALREVLEETNLTLRDVKFLHATNDPCIGGDMNKHYITLFMTGVISENSDALKTMEPNKCEGWEWVSWDDLVKMDHSRLFDPMIHFLEEFKSLPQ